MKIGDRVKCRFLGAEERGVIVSMSNSAGRDVFFIRLDSGCKTLKSSDTCEPE